MGLFDEPLFDFNEDGKTDALDFALATSIIEAIEEEGRSEKANCLIGEENEEDNLFDDEYDEETDSWL